MMRKTTFLELANHKRGDMYVKLKSRILRGNGIFTTHDVLDLSPYVEPGHPVPKCSWCDFMFLSKAKRNIFYNACIEIANAKLADMVRDRAMAAVMRTGFKFEPPKFIPAERDSSGKVITYTMEDFGSWDKPQEACGGFSPSEFLTKKEEELFLSDIQVYEEYILDTSYEYGIGLSMTVDEPSITEETVIKHVERFWAMGETEWKAEAPVPSDRLIRKRDWFRESGHMFSNMLTDLAFF